MSFQKPYAAAKLTNFITLLFTFVLMGAGSAEEFDNIYQEANAAYNKANQSGDFRPAIASALKYYTAARDQSKLHRGNSASMLALSYWLTGEREKAIKYMLGAVEEYGAVQEAKDKGFHEKAVENLCVFYREVGRDAEIVKLFEKKIEIRNVPAAPPESFFLFRMLYTNALERLGKREEAIAMLKPTIEAFSNNNSASIDTFSKIVRNCALSMSDMRRPKEGLALMKKQESVFSNTSRESLEIAKYWMILARMYRQNKAFKAAVPHVKKAYDIAKKVRAPKGDIGEISMELGDTYRLAGQMAKAEPLLQEAVEMCEAAYGKETKEAAEAYSAYGAFFSQIDNNNKAILYLKKSIDAAEKCGSEATAEVASKFLANVYRKKGNREMVAHYEAMSKALTRSIEAKRGVSRATWGLLDRVFAARVKVTAPGKTDEAIGELKVLLKETLSKQGDASMLYGDCLQGLMRAYALKDDLEKAELAAVELEKNLNRRKDDLTKRTWEHYFRMAIHRHFFEGKEARPWITGWYNRYFSNLKEVLTYGSEEDRLMHLRSWKPPYTLLHFLNDPEILANTALRTKGIVLDSMLEDRKYAQLGKGDEGNGLVKRLAQVRSQYRDAVIAGQEDSKITALDLEIGKIERELARYGANKVTARRALAVNWRHVQNRLPEDSALLEYVAFEEWRNSRERVMRYGVVIIPKKGKPKWAQLGMKGNIDSGIHRFLEEVQNGRDPKELSRRLSTLYRWLISDHVSTHIPKGTKKLFIAPDSELNFVPFACLLGRGGQFLCQQIQVNYVATGRDLLRRPESATSTNNELVFFGDPRFSNDDTEGIFSRLPGTKTEASYLRELLPSLKLTGKFHLNEGATEIKLRSVRSPKVLHLATHGFFYDGLSFQSQDSSNPMFQGGLALAGASDTIRAWDRGGHIGSTDSDGILLADEVADLNLQGTALVCLSACETGRGVANNGEGVFGLRRGFSQAGARHIVMALWPVADLETAQFMKEFYSLLAKGAHPDTALAIVQRNWLLKIQKEQGLLKAIRLAGPFMMSSYGVNEN